MLSEMCSFSQYSCSQTSRKNILLKDSSSLVRYEEEGLSSRSNNQISLRPVSEIPSPFCTVFDFPYFNSVQSKVIDDVLYSDQSLVVSAPTGSGKTVIFELAITRLLIYGDHTAQSLDAVKIVYMAPVKALCSERFYDWSQRFECVGLRCMELTGDSELEQVSDLHTVNIILTTPEKWDHMTRRWRDYRFLLDFTKLFLIDEVHMIGDGTRGATLEAVISRMKTVSCVSAAGSVKSSIRFIAVSATIPNIEDIAEWLSSKINKAAFHRFDESYRPVRLRKIVLGYPCSNKLSDFRFDMSLNYKLANVIQTYSDMKPTLVFCATRKGVVQAAMAVVSDCRFNMTPVQSQHLMKAACIVKDSKLKDLLQKGVAYHHAGMDSEDRRIVEAAFAGGEIAVLVATSTLAMGVNLPAHLVVVKSTMQYAVGGYQEYSETQILQMIGRAGRPQFDTSASAVIMTKLSSKEKYEALLGGSQVVESSLHQSLTEHLNAEVVLNTIQDVSVALDWIKSTYFYIRVNKNPKYYGIPVGLSLDKVEQKLQDMCLQSLGSLSSLQLLEISDDCFSLKTTVTGQLMARYSISYETMKNFHKTNGDEKLSDVLRLMCESFEFQDIQLRTNEKKILNTLNSDTKRTTIRFPLDGRIRTNAMKVNCLIQSQLDCIALQDFPLQQDLIKIMRVALRVSKCLVEVLWSRPHFTSLLNAVLLSKCLRAHLWENSKYVTKQIAGIGIAMARALFNADLTTFQAVAAQNPRDVELIVNRQPPFGSHICESASNVPNYQLSLIQMEETKVSSAEFRLTVQLMNVEVVAEKSTTDCNHFCYLIVGNEDNQIVYKAKIGDALLISSEGIWSTTITAKYTEAGPDINAYLISNEWVGFDAEAKLTLRFKNLRAQSLCKSLSTPLKERNENSLLPNQSSLGLKERKSVSKKSVQYSASTMPEKHVVTCYHRCVDKARCLHKCCKLDWKETTKASYYSSRLSNQPHLAPGSLRKRFSYEPRRGATSYQSTSSHEAEVESSAECRRVTNSTVNQSHSLNTYNSSIECVDQWDDENEEMWMSEGGMDERSADPVSSPHIKLARREEQDEEFDSEVMFDFENMEESVMVMQPYLIDSSNTIQTDWNYNAQPSVIRVHPSTTQQSITRQHLTTQQPSITRQHLTTDQPSITRQHITTEQPSITRQHLITQQPSITRQHLTTDQPSITRQHLITQQPSITRQHLTTDQPSITRQHLITQQPSITRQHLTTDQPSITHQHLATQQPSVTRQHLTTEQPSITRQHFTTDQPPMFGYSTSVQPSCSSLDATSVLQPNPRYNRLLDDDDDGLYADGCTLRFQSSLSPRPQISCSPHTPGVHSRDNSYSTVCEDFLTTRRESGDENDIFSGIF